MGGLGVGREGRPFAGVFERCQCHYVSPSLIWYALSIMLDNPQWVAGGGSMRENPGERKIIGGAEPAMPDLRQKATS